MFYILYPFVTYLVTLRRINSCLILQHLHEDCNLYISKFKFTFKHFRNNIICYIK
jgi:hypothetical protein